MGIIIVAATAFEIEAVLGVKPAPETPVRFYGRSIYPLVTGVGPIAAAASLGAFLGSKVNFEKELSGVIGVGIAGSFDLSALPLCSLALVGREICPEFGLVRGYGVHEIDHRGIGLPQDIFDSQPVFESLDFGPPSEALAQMGLRPTENLPPVVSSLTVLGATCFPERALELHKYYGASLENMEGFAFGLCCRRFQLPFVEIRAVSNLVGLASKREWDLKGALAALGKGVRSFFAP